jgi:hypothetical protein
MLAFKVSTNLRLSNVVVRIGNEPDMGASAGDERRNSDAAVG